MKPYSLDMRQKIANTYEAGNTSVRKVAERFLVRQKYGTEITQTKKRDSKITPSSGKRGEIEPTL
jgi:putative transposase